MLVELPLSVWRHERAVDDLQPHRAQHLRAGQGQATRNLGERERRRRKILRARGGPSAVRRSQYKSGSDPPLTGSLGYCFLSSILPFTALAVMLICVFSAFLSIRKVIKLEPAIVFKG